MFFGGINLKAEASMKESMTGLVVKPEVDISTATPSGIETADLESEVDDFMENYIGKTVQGASVIIMKDGKNILSKGYGYADYENDITVSPDKTVFEFASISKMYTWVSVMQQVEKGTIDLNQDIMTYLPKSFAKRLRKNLKYDQPITMLNLMNHNAGFEDNYLDCDFSKRKDL
jgi:CubicO group peptidase (beta-lactamase class C family)